MFSFEEKAKYRAKIILEQSQVRENVFLLVFFSSCLLKRKKKKNDDDTMHSTFI